MQLTMLFLFDTQVFLRCNHDANTNHISLHGLGFLLQRDRTTYSGSRFYRQMSVQIRLPKTREHVQAEQMTDRPSTFPPSLHAVEGWGNGVEIFRIYFLTYKIQEQTTIC